MRGPQSLISRVAHGALRAASYSTAYDPSGSWAAALADDDQIPLGLGEEPVGMLATGRHHLKVTFG